MTTKWVQLSKKATSQTITPCWQPLWFAVVRAGSFYCPCHLKTRLQLSSEHIYKRDSVTKDCTSAQILVDRARNHSNQTRRCIVSKSINFDLSIMFQGSYWTLEVGIVDNDESSAVTVADNRSVLPFYWGFRLTAASLILIFAIV